MELLKINFNEIVTTSKKCSICEKEIKISPTSDNKFISLDIRFQFELLVNRPDVKKHIQSFAEKRRLASNNKDIISDVHDGEIFRKIVRRYPGAWTYNHGTDGAALHKS